MPAAALIPAAITGVSSLVGGILGNNAEKKAANTVAAADTQGIKVINDAANAGNQGIGQAAGAAQTGVSQAAAAGQSGISAATAGGQRTVADLTAAGQSGVQAGAQAGIGAVKTATGQANDVLDQITKLIGSDLDPYKATGATGANALNDLVKNPYHLPTAAEAQATPGYQFRLSQGTQALSQTAAARGALGSGGLLKALQGYGTGLADTYYQSDVNNSLAARNQQFGEASGAANLGLGAENLYANTAGRAQEQKSANIVNAGGFEGSADINSANRIADLGVAGGNKIADLGMSGASQIAQIGTQGAQQIGNYGVGAASQQNANTQNAAQRVVDLLTGKANTQAAGIIGGQSQINQGITGVGNSLAQAYYNRKPPGTISAGPPMAEWFQPQMEAPA